jgi:voltage-gated potassium channel
VRSDELQRVENQLESRRSGRWLARRINQKGLRPRFAAYVIIAFWTAAIVASGVIERLVDPKTFHSIWLGMWWATETVTTVGYGDIVPQQTVGKLIAAFMMVGGLALLAVVTGAITSTFVTRAEDERRASGDDPMTNKLEEISSQLEAMRAELSGLQKQGDPGGPR